MGLLWKDGRNGATVFFFYSLNFFSSRKEKGDEDDEALCYFHSGKELVMNRIR